MKTVNAIKKLEKAGAEIKVRDNKFYTAFIGNDAIDFIDQDGSAICIRIRSKNDHDDSMTDYSAGVYCDNLTQALRMAA